jgi:uroporphyrin-3 C-methyltransferase
VNIENSNPGANPTDKVLSKDNDPGPGKASAPPKRPGDSSSGKRGGSFFLLLAILLAVLAATLSAWTWWQLQQAANDSYGDTQAEIAQLAAQQSGLARDVEQLTAALEAVTANDPGGAVEALRRQLETDRQQMARFEQSLAEQTAIARSLQAAAESMQVRLRAAEAAVTGISSLERGAGEELDLAEVDYLLRLAHERLQLFSDPRAADHALEVADMHLAAMNSPVHIGVRQEIAAARRALDAVETPDLVEVAGRLDSVQAQIPVLAFRSEATPDAGVAEQQGDGWWASLKSAFSGLVTVRRSTADESARMSLEDKDFIRQRAWLQLEMARLALMRQDAQAFRKSLERTAATLNTWFDPADASTAGALESIGQLVKTQIEVEMPDITGPWNLLQALRETGAALPSGAGQPVESEAGSEAG